MLDAKIERELDRLLKPVGGESGEVQIGEPAAVEPFLDAGDALVIDVDVTDDVRDLGAVGIDALVLAQKSDAGKAESMDLERCFGEISRLSQTKPRLEASRSRNSVASSRAPPR